MYLVDTLNILAQAGQIAVKPVDTSEDPDLESYLLELKTNVLNCYSSVITGAKESNMGNIVFEHANEIFIILHEVLKNNPGQTMSLILLVAGLVGDMSDCLGKQIL